ncbi:MAG: type II toxin-antitoxin system HigB family toxin [Candidatus Riflebacteria bacterium]|nr:type II toxin-antitoxin system HigB family toxin [Candidatus Riflebacteria bacterium]
MRIIARQPLKAFWERHPDVEGFLRQWLAQTRAALWKGPADIRRMHATPSFLGEIRVVFNVKGNRYRLVVHVRYDLARGYVRFVGTHAEYDRIDAQKV